MSKRDPPNGLDTSPSEGSSDEGHVEVVKKQKLTLEPGKKQVNTPLKKGIQMKLGRFNQKKTQPMTVAAAFNVDDDEEPEEMPHAARMKMRNLGRETPTSAGPNSFGKTKQGFCNAKKMFEKTMKKAMDDTTSTPNNNNSNNVE